MENFDNWNIEKKRLHYGGVIRTITEGEIWWCGIGQNVGIEINGKSQYFTRPVLIVKKLGRFGFIGVPLTSQEKIGSWYVSFIFKDKKQTATLTQARNFSVFRLHSRMGQIPNSDLNTVKDGLRKLYSK